MIRPFSPNMPAFDTDGGGELWAPEVWAAEALLALEPNMAAAASVYTDYSSEVAQFGDTINITTPGTFTARRKRDGDSVVKQAKTARRTVVSLNQHLYASFIVYDGEEAKGFRSLRDAYLIPAVQSIALGLDQIVLSQVYQFLHNAVGKIGTTPNRTLLIDAATQMNTNKAPVMGRRMFITPGVQGDLLNTDDFSHVDKSGSTDALIRGSLGEKYGWGIFMGQNTPSITEVGTTQTDTVSAAGGAVGATSIVVKSGLSSPQGGWMTIGGDMQPHRILTYDAYTKAVTFEIPLKNAVVEDAVVTVYDIGAINQGTDLDGEVTDGYPLLYPKEIAVDGFGTLPGAGRLTTFGTAAGAARYGLMTCETANSIMLDRPIEAAVADDEIVAAGPIGEYCFGFVPNAMALVLRPLPTPITNGAMSYVAENEDGTMGIRVTITYNGDLQGHLVTVDILAGIKTLDTRLGVAALA